MDRGASSRGVRDRRSSAPRRAPVRAASSRRRTGGRGRGGAARRKGAGDGSRGRRDGGDGSFRRILVPVDLTPKNAAALDMAERLAAGGGEVTLLHVIETLDLPFDELEDFYLKLEEDAGRGLGELGRRLKEAGIAVREHITYGKRAAAIVEYADEIGADLILLSSHRLDRERPDRWVTISHQVAILAECPVLLVK